MSSTESPQGPAGDAVDVSVASAPCNPGSVPGLLDDISLMRDNCDVSSNRDARLYLLGKARALVQALETPRETMLKHCGAETACFFALALGIDIGLFKEMSREQGSPKTATALAAAVGFDVDALRPILRHVAAMGHIVETGNDEYKPSNFSKALTIPIVADGYPLYRSISIAPMANLHKWLKINDYRAPTASRDNPFTFGNQTDLTFFEYLAAFPLLNDAFNNHMAGYRLGRPAWTDPSVYPVRANLLANFDPSSAAALLVDVGGNMGHDLERFRHAFPDTAGRLVLQDMGSVIEAAPMANLAALNIEAMPHDFFTPQPVQGARAYYLHHILHDWPDDKCEVIVGHIKGAMTAGYSRLLINEHIIPRVGGNWEATYLDLYMMVMFGARERTEDDWRALLEDRCGLRICRIWNPKNGVEGIIECEIPAVLGVATG